MRIALYQPDIAQNVGAILRLGACFNLPIDIIEPCGFPFSDSRFRRAGMDYIDLCEKTRHSSWAAFQADRPEGRLALLTTSGDVQLQDVQFEEHDVLLFGQESAGVPPEVHSVADLRIKVPMQPGLRSINLAQTAALVAWEAMRQTGTLPNSP